MAPIRRTQVWGKRSTVRRQTSTTGPVRCVRPAGRLVRPSPRATVGLLCKGQRQMIAPVGLP
jgi:hypothetical protein